MTVMNRLVEKGILEKRVEGCSSLYKPVLPRHEFLNTQSKELTNELSGECGHIVVSHMLDALEVVYDDLVIPLEHKVE